MKQRELKFRIWCLTEKRIIEPFAIQTLIEYNGGEYHDDDIYLQFTGLKDKNGVEIYEGDIVKLKNDNLFFEVKYGDGFAAFSLYYLDKKEWTKNRKGKLSGWDGVIGARGRLAELEVIGNIYENKNLIK